jgi:hypothetical protein
VRQTVNQSPDRNGDGNGAVVLRSLALGKSER